MATTQEQRLKLPERFAFLRWCYPEVPIWKYLKYTLIILTTVTSITTSVYILRKLNEDGAVSPIQVSPEVPSITPGKSTLTTEISTSSTEMVITTTTVDPEEVVHCESNTFTRDCCIIYGHQCTVQCRNCDRSAKQISDTIQCLSDKTTCRGIHLIFYNCSISLRTDWLQITQPVLSLSIIQNLDSFENNAFNSEIFLPMESFLVADVSLARLESTFFVGLFNVKLLKLINLRNFDFSSFNEYLFSGLPNLRNLEVSEMSYSMINVTAIAGHYLNMEILSLNKNNILYISPGGLSRMANLVEFNAVQSKIIFLDSQSFSGLPKLLRLNLQRNEIGSISQGALADIVHRTGARIDFSGNYALFCNCRLQELQSYLRNNFTRAAFVKPEELICAHPKCDVVIDKVNVCDGKSLEDYCRTVNKGKDKNKMIGD